MKEPRKYIVEFTRYELLFFASLVHHWMQTNSQEATLLPKLALTSLVEQTDFVYLDPEKHPLTGRIDATDHELIIAYDAYSRHDDPTPWLDNSLDSITEY